MFISQKGSLTLDYLYIVNVLNWGFIWTRVNTLSIAYAVHVFLIFIVIFPGDKLLFEREYKNNEHICGM